MMLFICVNSFAQKNYTFDYYTVYEFRTNEQDSVFTKNITIANSKNSNYFIKISTYANNTGGIYFYDFNSNEHYRFSFNGTINLDTDFDSLFKNPVPFKYLRKKATDKYDVIYLENEIIIRRYKNKRKKKIVSDYHLIVESNDLTKNQVYTSDIIFAYRFDIKKLKTDKIIKESFLIKYEKNSENKKENIRTLKDVQPIDFTLNIPETTNSITISKIKVQ